MKTFAISRNTVAALEKVIGTDSTRPNLMGAWNIKVPEGHGQEGVTHFWVATNGHLAIFLPVGDEDFEEEIFLSAKWLKGATKHYKRGEDLDTENVFGKEKVVPTSSLEMSQPQIKVLVRDALKHQEQPEKLFGVKPLIPAYSLPVMNTVMEAMNALLGKKNYGCALETQVASYGQEASRWNIVYDNPLNQDRKYRGFFLVMPVSSKQEQGKRGKVAYRAAGEI